MLSRTQSYPVPSFSTFVDQTRAARTRALLERAPLFRGVAPSALDDLARRMTPRSRRAGAQVLAANESPDGLVLVESGRVKVALLGDNREVTLAMLGPGDFFGEVSLLDGQPRAASVLCVDDSTLVTLSRDAFLDHLRAHPQTALNLAGELARRLRRADETIADLALCDVPSRLVRTLERMARADGGQTPEGLLLRRRPTQQELANMVGACRETISRAFSTLVAKGLLVPRGRALVLTTRLLTARVEAA